MTISRRATLIAFRLCSLLQAGQSILQGSILICIACFSSGDQDGSQDPTCILEAVANDVNCSFTGTDKIALLRISSCWATAHHVRNLKTDTLPTSAVWIIVVPGTILMAIPDDPKYSLVEP